MSRFKGRYDKLSEQEIIECARSPSNVLYGCAGGWHYAVYSHANTKNGVTTQAIKPYKGNTNSQCNVATPRTPFSKTKSSYYIVPNEDEKDMKESLYFYGPLHVAFYVSSDFYNYRSGVYTDSRGLCKSNYYNNHAVLLVGYGTENGLDYWLVKNSWGEFKFFFLTASLIFVP